MRTIDIAPGRILIPLDQPLTGFKDFIAAWLCLENKTAFLVDVGPASTVPVLASALEALGVRRLSAIFLTHIHIDHAGGAGDLLKHFPDVPVFCHPKAIPHLSDPTRLWEGSLKTLGKTAQAYGPIAPVPESLLQPTEGPVDLGADFPVVPYLTPGHAPHHVSFGFGDCLFGGEAAGVFMDLGNGDYYLRPATPPRFFLETSLESLESLLTVPHDVYCYGHFGATRQTPELLEAQKDQLHRWADLIGKELEKGDGQDISERCINTLLKNDPLMAAWDRLSTDVRERERGFLKNSVAGFLGYLKK